MAMEESRVLIWHRDKLKLSIIGDSFLQTVFDHILGRDVVKKLMQVTQVRFILINLFLLLYFGFNKIFFFYFIYLGERNDSDKQWHCAHKLC